MRQREPSRPDRMPSQFEIWACKVRPNLPPRSSGPRSNAWPANRMRCDSAISTSQSEQHCMMSLAHQKRILTVVPVGKIASQGGGNAEDRNESANLVYDGNSDAHHTERPIDD